MDSVKRNNSFSNYTIYIKNKSLASILRTRDVGLSLVFFFVHLKSLLPKGFKATANQYIYF